LSEDMKEKLLAERKRLYAEFERFSGMPTLEYDSILDDLERKIKQIEEQLTTTCRECGGEKMLYGAGSDEIHGMHNPPNGLCDCPSSFEKAWKTIRG